MGGGFGAWALGLWFLRVVGYMSEWGFVADPKVIDMIDMIDDDDDDDDDQEAGERKEENDVEAEELSLKWKCESVWTSLWTWLHNNNIPTEA